ncbi:hypothetical protein ACTFAO_07550 [Sphingobacterium spiritivorum]|uniref:hypothetical protein n=1 Tax=Sphingobacterium spiritivorum TaxID=258 RepID=UPI003F770BD0
MKKYYFGQQFIDHKRRSFTIIALYWAAGQWSNEKPATIYECERGFQTHIQGKFDSCEVVMLGFANAAGEYQTMTIADAEKYEKKNLINFE